MPNDIVLIKLNKAVDISQVGLITIPTRGQDFSKRLQTIARYLDWGATVCKLIHENWCNMKSICLMYLNPLPIYRNGVCILTVIEEVTVTRPPVLSYYISLEHLGADSIKIYRLTSIGNSIVEIRRSYDRLISTMGFPILIRWHLYIESGPRCP